MKIKLDRLENVHEFAFTPIFWSGGDNLNEDQHILREMILLIVGIIRIVQRVTRRGERFSQQARIIIIIYEFGDTCAYHSKRE